MKVPIYLYRSSLVDDAVFVRCNHGACWWLKFCDCSLADGIRMDDIPADCFVRDGIYTFIAINAAIDVNDSSFGGITKRGF